MEPWANVSRAQWALLIISTPVYFFAADAFHRRAIKELFALWRSGSSTPVLRRFYRFGSMNLLMSLGTSIAYFASITELIISSPGGSNHPMSNRSIYFDSVVFLTMFLLIGRLIEAWSRAKTANAVTSLGQLRLTEAIIYDSTQLNKTNADLTRSTPVDTVEARDIILVSHGSSPPCDGILLDGQGSFDESNLTGESKLVMKSAGDDILSRTVNQGHPIRMRATKIVGSSMLDQIIHAVREGQARRAPVERLGDTTTSYFVPVITAISISTWFIRLALGETGSLPADWLDVESGGWPYWSLQFSTAVFIIACPCGFGLAAPTALFVGGGIAAKHGIPAKGGGEAFQEVSMKGLFTSHASDAYPDKSFMVLIGNERLMSESNVNINTSVIKTLETWKLKRKSVLVAIRMMDLNSSSVNTWTLHLIAAVSDPIRPESPLVVQALQKQGIEVWMISSDNAITTHTVGQMVGIPSDRIIAGVLPEQKADKVQYLQRSQPKLLRSKTADEKATVAMVGDGVNDSPALIVADVGIAIRSGSDVAISSADFVLVSPNLSALLVLLQLSRVVFRRIKFNFGWALVYNLIALLIAAGVLYPIRSHGSHVRLDPVWASLPMALSSISVVSSSLALTTKLPFVGFRSPAADTSNGSARSANVGKVR